MAQSNFNQFASIAIANGDVVMKNTDTVDFAAGNVVKLDTTNVESATQAPGALLSTDTVCIGICVDAIPQGKNGRVRMIGAAVAVASGAIAAGALVDSASSGQVATHGSGTRQLGVALNKATGAGDFCLVMVVPAANA
jgi:hypothetical protein